MENLTLVNNKNILQQLLANKKIIFILLIIIYGFYLRTYHIDYPAIGYHNWKETHYLTEARNFAKDGFFKDGFFIPSWDYPSIKEDSSGAHRDTFPTTSIIVAILFKIFGFSLAIARLPGVIAGVASILLIYLITKKLFQKDFISIIAAFLMAINPLSVFFSRNTQLDSISLFFMLCGLYYFIIWLDNDKPRYFALFSFFVMLATVTKYTFLIVLIPLVFIFPYERLIDFKKYIKQYIIGLILFIPFPAWFFYSQFYLKKFNLSGGVGSDINYDFSVLFNSEFWQVIKSYVADNFTLTGILFFFLGAILFLLFYDKTKRSQRFMLGSLIGLILFMIITVNKLNGHNYHQYPMIFTIIIFISYFFISCFNILNKIIKIRVINYLFILILIVILTLNSISAKDRMFDTQFIGLDIAGDYVNKNSNQAERIFFPSHQSYGSLWHADRKGIKTPSKLDDFIFAENNLNASWIFIYQWGFSIIENKEVWQHIQENYKLRQIAFLNNNQGLQPIYIVLSKGGRFDITKINEYVKDKQISSKEYEFSKGKQKLDYINIE